MPTQDHIHLALTNGGAPENAPIYKWKTLERIPIPRLLGSIEYTMTGHVRFHNALDEEGEPIRPLDMMYVVIVREEYGYDVEDRLQQLLDMYGKVVKLVDHKHANDGSDHTDDIREMYLGEIGEIVPKSVGLFRYEVEINLTDASRR